MNPVSIPRGACGRCCLNEIHGIARRGPELLEVPFAQRPNVLDEKVAFYIETNDIQFEFDTIPSL